MVNGNLVHSINGHVVAPINTIANGPNLVAHKGLPRLPGQVLQVQNVKIVDKYGQGTVGTINVLPHQAQ